MKIMCALTWFIPYIFFLELLKNLIFLSATSFTGFNKFKLELFSDVFESFRALNESNLKCKRLTSNRQWQKSVNLVKNWSCEQLKHRPSSAIKNSKLYRSIKLQTRKSKSQFANVKKSKWKDKSRQKNQFIIFSADKRTLSCDKSNLNPMCTRKAVCSSMGRQWWYRKSKKPFCTVKQ